MIQTETALMRKRNKSDHIKSIRFFFEKNSINSIRICQEKWQKKTELIALTNWKNNKTIQADWTFKRIKFVFQIYLDVHEFVL